MFREFLDKNNIKQLEFVADVPVMFNDHQCVTTMQCYDASGCIVALFRCSMIGTITQGRFKMFGSDEEFTLTCTEDADAIKKGVLAYFDDVYELENGNELQIIGVKMNNDIGCIEIKIDL